MDTRPTSSLREWKDNPRSITKDGYERLKKQIQKLGQYKPLLITPDNEVLGGNMRLKAYRELGITDAWVSVVEPKDENGKLEYALSDNDRAGFYDDDLLANLVSNYDIDWSHYSVDLNEPTNLQNLLDQFKEVIEDEVPEVSDEPAVSKLDEVYQLGRHRLMCGDSTKIEDVEKLMDGKKADMVFTDPPYGIDYQSNSRKVKFEKIDGDNAVSGEWINLAGTFTKGWIVFWCAWQKLDEWITAGKVLGVLTNILIWKKSAAMGDLTGQFSPTYEMALAYNRGQKLRDGVRKSAVFDYNIENPSGYVHPTQKPIGLITDIFSGLPMGDVLDLFGGSGSTLIACEQTNRTCYMMELDPKYCDVIRKRYSKFIGKEDKWQAITPQIIR